MAGKQLTWAWVVVGVVIIGLLGWLAVSRQSAIPVTAEKTTIGAILPLTGGLAKVGSDVKTALEIAQADLKVKAPNIMIKYEDDAFVPEKSVTAFNKLIAVDGASFILGPLNGSSIEAVRPLAAKKQVVAFTPWGAGSKIGDFTIKNSVEADDEARVIARKAVQELGLKHLGILYLQNDFGLVHEAAFRSEVEKLGAQLAAAEPVPFGATDFRSSLTKIKGANVDGLYIVHNGGIVGQITKQAKELGLNTQYFGQYATESSDLINVGGDSLEGLMYTFPLNEARLTNRQKDFIEKFEAKVGGKPQVAAYNAYDIYSIYADALSECKPNDGQCIRDYILSLENYDGIGGKVSFTSGRLEREFFFKTIRNGQFIAL